MKYYIEYCYASNKGNLRKNNQDNYSCNGAYKNIECENIDIVKGRSTNTDNIIMAVFDGLGGEEKGEMAAYIAAKNISRKNGNKYDAREIEKILMNANYEICSYAKENNIESMGTTVALLGFYKNKIILSNIGDSKIFRFSKGNLEQISKDHTMLGIYGMKPSLSQFLGIPPSEMIIVPYVAQGNYEENDIYIICSDGLTDMVSPNEMREIINNNKVEYVCRELMNNALLKGGKDNITIAMCNIKKKKLWG